MFYTGNDNYMQDIYFYNQNPNTYHGINGFPNGANNNYWGQNASYINSNMMPNNINMLYPSIYRIIMPVILRVIQNSNYQFINEDILNNMVDTVYNIVDGQIEYTDETNNSSNQSSNSTVGTNNQTTRNNEQRAQSSNTTNQTNNNRKDNPLLRDIIKILILRELMMRNQMVQPQMYNPNYNMNY